MYPAKLSQMKFHDPVAPMPMCGESFSIWLEKRDKKETETVSVHQIKNYEVPKKIVKNKDKFVDFMRKKFEQE